MNDSAVGRVIADRYEIIAPIDEGGMGSVYVALQRSLNRKVAIKLILPALRSRERAVKRFLLEAQTASQLNHPNIVSVYDFGETSEGGEPELYLVMELLAGSTLRAVMDSGTPLTPPRVIDILCQLLAGLADAHERGITHRDVKPDNIFLQPRRRGGDHVKLIDFGLARIEREQSVTLKGQFVGTPVYSAPERGTGEHSPLADLYSVGVVLYEMLTGVVPFDSPYPVELLKMHRREPRPDPTVRAPEVPRALADVCMRAMAIAPGERFPNAEAMVDALQAAGDGRPSEPPVAAPPASASSFPGPLPGSKSVLVVEDDASVRKLLVHMLRTRYTVHEAEDGFAAASLLEQIPLPDLILSDVMMPRMDGLALARYLKSQNHLREIPIIFLSARGESKDVIAGIQAGARHYLTKPVQMKELLERVARTIAKE